MMEMILKCLVEVNFAEIAEQGYHLSSGSPTKNGATTVCPKDSGNFHTPLISAIC